MNRPLLYLILFGVVAGSCLAEYCGVWLTRGLPPSKQNRLAVGGAAMCAAALALFRSNLFAVDAVVLLSALMAGTLLGRGITSFGSLGAFLIAGAVADMISTSVGPSRWLVAHARHANGEAWLRFLAVSVRLRGKLVPVIGVGDLMFFALLSGAVKRFGWSNAEAFAIPLAALIAALAVGLYAGFTPALPFLAVAVLLYGRVKSAPARSKAST